MTVGDIGVLTATVDAAVGSGGCVASGVSAAGVCNTHAISAIRVRSRASIIGILIALLHLETTLTVAISPSSVVEKHCDSPDYRIAVIPLPPNHRHH